MHEIQQARGEAHHPEDEDRLDAEARDELRGHRRPQDRRAGDCEVGAQRK
jgi:hypothetical protein